MPNVVKLLDEDIIYVEKVGRQTEETMFQLAGQINQLVAELREREQTVLILSNTEQESIMDEKTIAMATKIGTDMDYDKSATYGASAGLHKQREQIAEEADLHSKVANFATREEAIDWLLAKT